MEDVLAWTSERRTFGAAPDERQVIRHELADMVACIDVARAMVYGLRHRLAHRLGTDHALVACTCLAKVVATQAMPFCADQAVQLLNGIGDGRGARVERVNREVNVMMTGGGSEEIMKDRAARKLGL